MCGLVGVIGDINFQDSKVFNNFLFVAFSIAGFAKWAIIWALHYNNVSSKLRYTPIK